MINSNVISCTFIRVNMVFISLQPTHKSFSIIFLFKIWQHCIIFPYYLSDMSRDMMESDKLYDQEFNLLNIKLIDKSTPTTWLIILWVYKISNNLSFWTWLDFAVANPFLNSRRNMMGANIKIFVITCGEILILPL